MKGLSLYFMAVVYVVAGINHFLHPAIFKTIMPSWLPYQHALIIISGVFEIILGLLLLFQNTRRIAAYCIIILLIAIFPANIQMFLNYLNEGNQRLWIAIARLPLQLVLIYWAYTFTRVDSSNNYKDAQENKN